VGWVLLSESDFLVIGPFWSKCNKNYISCVRHFKRVSVALFSRR